MKNLFTRKIKMWTVGCMTVLVAATANAENDAAVCEVLGDYKGTLSIALGETPIVSLDTISITSSLQENSVKFSLEDFTLNMGALVIPVGDIVLDSITVKSYSWVDSLLTKTIDLTVSALGQTLPATVTLSGAVVQDSVFIDLTVATSMMGAPIIVPVNFKGAKIQGAVANEVLNVAPAFWAVDRRLYINAAAPGIVRVYSVTGQLVRQTVVGEGQTTIPLPKGFYIVSLNDKTQKVLVK